MSARERTNRSSPTRPLVPRLPPSTLRSLPAPRLAVSHHRPSPPAYVRPSSTPVTGTPHVRISAAEDVTPIKTSPLNITPRSSARKIKNGSANSTPTQSNPEPNGTISPPTYRTSALGHRSVITGTADSDVDSRNGHFTGFMPLSPSARPLTAPISARGAQPTKPSELGSSFFRAGDGPLQGQQPQRPLLEKKASTFVYADGRRETGNLEPSVIEPIVKPTLPMAITSPSPNTFFYARGDPANIGPNDPAPSLPPDSPSSITSTSPGLKGLAAIATRSQSPTKFDFHLSYRKGASQIIRPPTSGRTSPSPGDAAMRPQTRRRPSSLDTIPEPQEYGRKSKTSSVEPEYDVRAGNPKHTSRLSASSEHTDSSAGTSGNEVPIDSSTARITSQPSSSLHDPTSKDLAVDTLAPEPAAASSQDSLAASARQARKVLDLEISNSSLLAINRSLEREMRRQKAELRRLRRVTRNNARASWLSDGTSMSLVNHLTSLDEVVDLEGEGSDDDHHDELSEFDSTTLSDGAMSPASLAIHDATHLHEDRRRMEFDLSKQRDLLVDSQKMNLSLKRCLGMTEQLIKDGGKALEYRVSVADVQLGGRVLSPEELSNPEAHRAAYDYFDQGKRQSEGVSDIPSTPDLIEPLEVGFESDQEGQLQIVSETLSELEAEMF